MKINSAARIFGIVLVMSFVSGCSNFAAGRYSTSTDNTMALKSIKPNKINVGGFASLNGLHNELACRLIYPIRTVDGESYAELVRKALIDELRVADAYSKDSQLVITGRLDELNFSSISGNTVIAVTISLSNGQKISVRESFSFPTGLISDENACNQAAQSLTPAIQNLLQKIIINAEFKSFISM